jgi:hypothetical protein
MWELKNVLILIGFFAFLGAGTWVFIQIAEAARRKRPDGPRNERGLLIAFVMFVAISILVGMHLNGGIGKSLAEMAGGDPEMGYRGD